MVQFSQLSLVITANCVRYRQQLYSTANAGLIGRKIISKKIPKWRIKHVEALEPQWPQWPESNHSTESNRKSPVSKSIPAIKKDIRGFFSFFFFRLFVITSSCVLLLFHFFLSLFICDVWIKHNECWMADIKATEWAKWYWILGLWRSITLSRKARRYCLYACWRA